MESRDYPHNHQLLHWPFLVMALLFLLSLAEAPVTGNAAVLSSPAIPADSGAQADEMPPFPGLIGCPGGFCWGLNQGWGNPQPPYADDLHGTPVNFFIEKIGAGLGTGEFKYAVTENPSVGGLNIIELGVDVRTLNPANSKYVYWYPQGPGYFDHCDANGGGKTPYQLWALANKLLVDDEANLKLFGEKQADAFMDRYLLQFHSNAQNKDIHLYDVFKGNTLFVDFEQPIPQEGQSSNQAANCGWGGIGLGWSIDPANPDHAAALANQLRRNKIVLSGFLERLRLRLDANFQKGLIPRKKIGLYTRTNLFNSTDRILPSTYRFPESMVLWLAEYPGGTTCTVPDETTGEEASIHPLVTDPRANVMSIAVSPKDAIGYGVFSGNGKFNVLGLTPVIWQYCNDNDVTNQDPAQGFIPRTDSTFLAEPPPFPVQLSCQWVRPAAANGTCAVDLNGCTVKAHASYRADCFQATAPEFLIKVSCTGTDCARRVNYRTRTSGSFSFSSTYPNPSLIPPHNLLMTSHAYGVTPYVQNALGTVYINSLWPFDYVQDVPGSWQSSAGTNWLWMGLKTNICSSICGYNYEVDFEGWVIGCPTMNDRTYDPTVPKIPIVIGPQK